MSLETLRGKVERLIEKAQNAEGDSEISPTQYEFYKNYIEGKLSGDIVIPDWFVPYSYGGLFGNQPNVTSLDTGSVTSLSGYNSPTYKIYALPTVKKIYFKNVTYIGERIIAFVGGQYRYAFKNIEVIEFGKPLQTMYSAWTNSGGERSKLTNIIIPQGWYCPTYFHTFTNLSTESLHAMIENLADLTGQDTQTFKIGTGNIAKIDDEHIAMLENKNWELS